MHKFVLNLVVATVLITGCRPSNPSGPADNPGYSPPAFDTVSVRLPAFVGYWNVSGWTFTSSMGGPALYTSGGDSCFLDIRANGTYSGWAIRYKMVRKSTGTWSADDYFITFTTSDGWDEEVTWQVSKSQTSANLNLVSSSESGVVHEMCDR
jgi:hypothetical protein